MFIVPLVVDPSDDDMLVTVLPPGEPDFAAGVARSGKPFDQLQGRLGEQGRIDPIVGERISQRDRPATVACRRGESRPVTGKHRCRGDVGPAIGRL